MTARTTARIDTERALALGREIVAASPADETEVTVNSEVEGFVRFADVGPTQSGDRSRLSLGIRARFRDGDGYREARAEAGCEEPEEWRAALDRAVELARISPVNDDACPLEGAVQVPATAADGPTLSHDFAAKTAWVQRAVRACEENDLRPAGLARTTGIARAIVNSVGREVGGETARAYLSLTASGRDGAGIGTALCPRVGDLDADATIHTAVSKAVHAQGPAMIDAGEYTVVLEPAAVSSILLFASYYGFGAREVEEKSSFLCDRVGTRAFAESVTIRDDVLNPMSPGLPFDGEGNAKRSVTLVDAGTLCDPVTDRHYAAKLGLPCTGHAAPQPNTAGPAAKNLVVQTGAPSLEELIGGVERGLLVTQFHYTNMIEPRELTLTGMTRNGTFLIEKGEVKHAVKNLRFTDTLVRALANVTGVGREPVVAGALFSGEIVTPALRVEGFRFTSCTDF